MTDLIARTRRMIHDPTGADQHYSDDELQAALDRRRRDVVELPLDPIVSRDAEGNELALAWAADRSPWESGAVLLDGSKLPIESDTADHMTGVWTFVESQDEVYVSGRSFDIYGAAADLLDEWNALSAASGDIESFETDGQKITRAKSSDSRTVLANTYRAHALPTIARFDRDDLWGVGRWG